MSADVPDMGFIQIIRNKRGRDALEIIGSGWFTVQTVQISRENPPERQKLILSAEAVRLTESGGNCVCHAIEGLCVIPMCFPSLR